MLWKLLYAYEQRGIDTKILQICFCWHFFSLHVFFANAFSLGKDPACLTHSPLSSHFVTPGRGWTEEVTAQRRGRCVDAWDLLMWVHHYRETKKRRAKCSSVKAQQMFEICVNDFFFNATGTFIWKGYFKAILPKHKVSFAYLYC